MTSPPNRPWRAALGVTLMFAIDVSLLALGFGSYRRAVTDPRALALLAIWAAANTTLAIARPVRGQDVEVSERDPRALALLLLVPLVTPMLAALGARLGWLMLPHARAVSWAGVALAALGLGLRVTAMRQLGRRFSPLVAVQRDHVLETRGLYAAVRHPGYLGALLSCLGAALSFGSALALPLPALMAVAQRARIRREEAVLARHFGPAWESYASRTGMLFPAPPRRR